MVPPETMMELAQTDRIIIGIHLFKKKKLHLFYYPKQCFPRHFLNAKIDK